MELKDPQEIVIRALSQCIHQPSNRLMEVVANMFESLAKIGEQTMIDTLKEKLKPLGLNVDGCNYEWNREPEKVSLIKVLGYFRMELESQFGPRVASSEELDSNCVHLRRSQFTCDGCRISPIPEPWMRCITCYDETQEGFDLCSKCFRREHIPGHKFLYCRGEKKQKDAFLDILPNVSEQELEILARQGLAEAQYKLGLLHVDKLQPLIGAMWFSFARLQNHPLATHHLGNIFSLGAGVEQNSKAAVECYTVAAKLGVSHSQFMLAQLCLTGTGGFSKNMEEGRMWLLKAAQQGYDTAYYLLGWMELAACADKGCRAEEGFHAPSCKARDFLFEASRHLKLVKRLGSGNFGEVYMASYKGRTVAAKKIIGDTIGWNPKVWLEASNFSRLMHPNIIKHVGEAYINTDQYILMEYMNLGSLSSVLQKCSKDDVSPKFLLSVLVIPHNTLTHSGYMMSPVDWLSFL